MRAYALLLALTLASTSASGRTWRILPDGSGDAPTIQAGVDSAASGDTVLVAEGLYAGSGNKDIEIFGLEILVCSEEGPSATIIDCEGEGRGFDVCLDSAKAATVRGFTIRGGNAVIGGGVLLRGDSVGFPMLADCRVVDNRATYSGGGIGITGRVIARVTRCVVQANEAPEGGGLAIGGNFTKAYVESTVVTGNAATGAWGAGGGISTGSIGWVEVRSSTISGNRSARYGGGLGLRWEESGTIYLAGSIVWDNCAPEGEEIYFETGFSMTCCCVDTTNSTSGGLDIADFCDDCLYTNPLFCGAVGCESAPTAGGTYSLDAASPCLPENNPCGLLIGALGEGCGGATAVPSEGERIVGRLLSLENRPNPFNPATAIKYVVPVPGPVTLTVHDITGRRVTSLLDGACGPGESVVVWNGKDARGADAPSGIYLARLRAGEHTATRRIILLR